VVYGNAVIFDIWWFSGKEGCVDKLANKIFIMEPLVPDLEIKFDVYNLCTTKCWIGI
jgi:hypothetical protein